MGWWIGTAKSGREFEVRDAILSLGGYAWVAREFRTTRPPTMRRHVPVVAPFLGKYVFIQIPDDLWQDVHAVKHMGGTMLPVSDAAAKRYLTPFMDRIDVDFAERQARFNAGEKLEAYKPGDLLRVLAGPLADQIVTFERIVTGATDLEDKLRAKLMLLGGPVAVTLDPLHVRMAAE